MPSAGFTWHVCLSWFSKHLISLLSTHVEFLWEQELLFFKDQIHVVCQLCMWKAYVKWDLGWWCWLSMKGLLCCWSFRLSKVEFQVFIVTRGCCYIKTNMRERRNTCSCPGPSLMPVICICVCVCVCTQLCPILGSHMDCGPPGSSVHGILQARILEWVAMPSSRGSSPPRDQTCFSCMAGRFVTIESAGKCIGHTVHHPWRFLFCEEMCTLLDGGDKNVRSECAHWIKCLQCSRDLHPCFFASPHKWHLREKNIVSCTKNLVGVHFKV